MDDPYKVHIDPQRATELAQSRAIILLLDVPNGTVVGIDQQVRSHRSFCRLFEVAVWCKKHRKPWSMTVQHTELHACQCSAL